MTIFIFYPIFILLLGSALYFLSTKIGLIDKPDSRKIHSGNIPLIGGIVGGISIYIFSIFLIDNPYLHFIIFSSFLILIIGLLDDIFDIHFSYRLVLQSIIILIVIDYGIIITDIGSFKYFGKIELGFFGILLTFICISGLTNSINFIDGSDGVCASSIFISFLNIIFFSLISSSNINWTFFYLILVYLIIFIYFNIVSEKYKIFLGDSGSTFFGFLLSLSLIYFTKDELSYFEPVLVIWCVALPVYDLLSVIIKRMIDKKNPFLPDRTHIHHILIKKNNSKFQIFFLLAALQLLFSIVGILSFILIGPEFTLLNFIVVFLLYLIFKLKIDSFD